MAVAVNYDLNFERIPWEKYHSKKVSIIDLNTVSTSYKPFLSARMDVLWTVMYDMYQQTLFTSLVVSLKCKLQIKYIY